MKLAIFSRSTSTHFISGGMESHLKNLVEGLSAAGHQVTVFTTSHPTQDQENIIETTDIAKEFNGVKYLYLGDTTSGLNPLTFWESIFKKLGLMNRNNLIEGTQNYYARSSEAFLKQHINDSFDCVISQSTAAKGLLNHPGLKVPILCIIHGTILNEIKSRLRSNRSFKNWVRFLIVDIPRWIVEHFSSNRKFFSRCKYIVAVSKDLRNKFLTDYPKLKHRVRVIYNGVDDSLFSPGTEKYHDFTALFIGRIDREKGVDLLINAVSLSRRKGSAIKAKIIGTGIHIYEFKRMVTDLKLDNEIEFLGSIPNDKLVEYYQKCHVFVLPTRREEGHPMTLSEAFCSGLPVIATKKGGLAELITDSKDGYYIDTSSATSLAYLLNHLYDTPKLLSEMSLEARKTGEIKFSKRAMIHGYNLLLDKI